MSDKENCCPNCFSKEPPTWTERSFDGNSQCSVCGRVSANRDWCITKVLLPRKIIGLLKSLEEKYEVAVQRRKNAEKEMDDLDKNYWFGVLMAYGDVINSIKNLVGTGND